MKIYTAPDLRTYTLRAVADPNGRYARPDMSRYNLRRVWL